MLRRTRLAGIAAISVPVLGLGASEAEAASDTGTDNVTFHRRGVEVTCVIEGSTSVDYLPQRDTSIMTARTELASGSDPECEPNIAFLSATGTYRVDGRTGEDFFQATSGETVAAARAGATGVVVELDGEHLAEFLCDEGPMRCVARVGTSPK